MTGADHLVEILKDLLEEAGRDPASVAVLDVAAGTGIAGEGLAKAGFNKITALDFSPEMLKVAEKGGSQALEVHARDLMAPSTMERRGRYWSC